MKEKAGGVGNINVKKFKTISDYIAEPFLYVFTLCIEQSTWPSPLKNADVPIYKSGNKSNILNYTPISLLSNTAKIFEK